MAEFEASRGMPADSRIVFDVAADLAQAHRWLPDGVHLHDQGGNVVSADGEQVGGPDQAHEGLYRIDPEQLRVEWGGRDHPGYAGWLQVADGAGGSSEVTLHLTFLDEDSQPPDPEKLQLTLDGALDRLAEQVGSRLQSG